MSETKTLLDMKWALAVMEHPPQDRNPDWWKAGACGPEYAENGTDPWYGPDVDEPGHRPGNFPADLANKARKICRACPVKTECLLHAMETPENEGVWGGVTPYQRTRLRNQLAAKAADKGRGVAA